MFTRIYHHLARLVFALISVSMLTVSLPARATPAPAAIAESDWPQLGRDPQRTNASPQQVDGPYCFTWKWYEVPFASRAQPVVAGGRLFIGGMDGVLYARDATSGAPLWSYATGGPIRHTAAVSGSLVFTGSHDGTTYALDAASGALRWRAASGPSATAPLVDPATGRVFVASTNGALTALRAADGLQLWQYRAGAPILTSPSLSADGQTVFLGDESIHAIAVRAADGRELWRVLLRGQSLADRYPVVGGDSVYYRSQPLDYFHLLLQEDGDDVMDRAGPRLADWAADWAAVRPAIVAYLTATPYQQTFFALRASDGASRGVAPLLYTYGSNDIPAVPVVSGTNLYIPFRARHGIQTDSSAAVHVTTRYDAELGVMNPTNLDITGLRTPSTFDYQFRLTSDEAAMLTLSGNLLLVDNWERLGGMNLAGGELVHLAGVSNTWAECAGECGSGTLNPFFPMQPGQAAYPFPNPRVNEGHSRGGAVVGSNMIYWRVIEGGIGALSHSSGACPSPRVWPAPGASTAAPARPPATSGRAMQSTRTLADYITLDLTGPITSPSPALVERLRAEVADLVDSGGHLMPFYLQRGFSTLAVWPADVPYDKVSPPVVTYRYQGNVYWHDPGELLYTLAMAYPYLDAALQARARAYVGQELGRYPVLEDLPYNESRRDWLRAGVARERYAVPFRADLSNWPPVAVSLQSLYGLWLWSKNTGDWSYAQTNWARAKELFNERRAGLGAYYADIAGAIGYVRLAQHFGDTAAVDAGTQAAVAAMESGRSFQSRASYASSVYPDPREVESGWSMPVLYGLTPEIGLYLREQTGGAAASYITVREQGEASDPNGMRWWYLTRAGAHAEVGETSYLAPTAAWSHFLAHAYILGDSRATLERWLDRPWGRGDLYSIQKIIATIHAPNTDPPPTPTPAPKIPVHLPIVVGRQFTRWPVSF
ncbi:MAG: PQQ-binding-like beta-propeller repeat protein [Chloroflexales bacterium]|nr:PQQ-binding-like beta-propeller repeat protein [Chloroflexales bacterium]